MTYAELQRAFRVLGLDNRGTRVLFAGETAIIASEVKKGEAILKLRDESGVPAWGGWRR